MSMYPLVRGNRLIQGIVVELIDEDDENNLQDLKELAEGFGL